MESEYPALDMPRARPPSRRALPRLLADKQELSKRCEALTEQAKAVEDKYEAQLAKQEEGCAKS